MGKALPTLHCWLLRGLRTGEADGNGDRTVTVFELGDYARRTVPGLARNVGHQQTPLIIKFGRDLPLLSGRRWSSTLV